MSRSSLMVLAALVVSACATPPIDPQLEASAGYQQGYADGCTTAKDRSKTFDRDVTRNADSYKEDELYRRGWNMGYRNCGASPVAADPYAESGPDWKNKGPLGAGPAP